MNLIRLLYINYRLLYIIYHILLYIKRNTCQRIKDLTLKGIQLVNSNPSITILTTQKKRISFPVSINVKG